MKKNPLSDGKFLNQSENILGICFKMLLNDGVVSVDYLELLTLRKEINAIGKTLIKLPALPTHLMSWTKIY